MIFSEKTDRKVGRRTTLKNVLDVLKFILALGLVVFFIYMFFPH